MVWWARHVGLPAETSFDAHFACDGCDLIRKGRKRVRHIVDGFRQRCDFALRVHRQLLSKIAVGDSGHDFDDSAHLLGEVDRHDVHVVGKILPRTSYAGHFRLAAELAVGADFTRHTSDLSGERVELIHHRIDRIL